jgi:hypothetical protein
MIEVEHLDSADAERLTAGRGCLPAIVSVRAFGGRILRFAGPGLPPVAAGNSISDAQEPPHDPSCPNVHPPRCLSNNRRYVLQFVH